MKKTIIAAIAATFATLGAAQAQRAPVEEYPARVELHWVQTTTLSDEKFLKGERDGFPTIVGGELRLPQGTTAKFPAVLMVPGSSGFSASGDMWVHELNAQGIATFMMDGYTGRGLVSVAQDQDLLGRTTQVIDVYRSLALLANHPRIDRNRIALMGFSRGAQVTLIASMKRFQQMWNNSGADFAAYVTLYAPCGLDLIGGLDIVDKPFRMHHGTADNYVPVAPCRTLVEKLRTAGKDITLTEYADAHHSYDSPILSTTPAVAPLNQTARRCQMKEEPLGILINAETKARFTHKDPCVELGPMTGANEPARKATIQSVKDFYRQVFKTG